MTNHRHCLAVLALLTVLATSCVIDLRDRPVGLVNATDETIWYQLTREPGTSRLPIRVEPGASTAVGGHSDPCLSFDTLRITADDPAEVEAPDVLLEHDLHAQPVCEGERWTFNGHALVQNG